MAPDGPACAPAIEARGLRKVYGRKVALHDLTLTVQPGEVFGFLGPNGAGKTTTIKILTGLVTATAGAASIFGRPVSDRLARQRVGYLPEHFRFHDWLTGAELLDFHGRLAGLTVDERRVRIPEVLRLVGLEGRGDEKVRGYSKGMTQRIGLAQAVLHRPDLVLLDEPSSALDPVGRREVRDLIRHLRADGVTVFLNSHLLGEVEMICDRVAIVDRGRVVREGPLAEVVGGVPELRLTLDRADRSLLAILERHGTVVAIEPAGPERVDVLLTVDDADVAPAVTRDVVGAGAALYGLVPSRRSLEDVFVSLVEGGER
ncbi:MAG: ABC transporter ATP-binding protein [Chloroflexi bacterium]|nr:ABC transporter ATP-binding protein [Chloroflexota bacterium]